MSAIEAARTLFRQGRKADAVALVERAAAAGVADRVHFTGSVPHEEVQRYLQAADVFVLNTRYEGLSHVLLEAMAAGVPVVASAVGGNPEVIEHDRNGLLVALDDGDAIAQHVARLLADNSLAARLRAEAGRDVEAYRWDELVERTARTLEALGTQSR